MERSEVRLTNQWKSGEGPVGLGCKPFIKESRIKIVDNKHTWTVCPTQNRTVLFPFPFLSFPETRDHNSSCPEARRAAGCAEEIGFGFRAPGLSTPVPSSQRLNRNAQIPDNYDQHRHFLSTVLNSFNTFLLNIL